MDERPQLRRSVDVVLSKNKTQIFQQNLEFGVSVVDESQDHAVQVDEEAEQVVAQFDHGLLHVGLELTAIVDLCGVKHSQVPHRHLHVPVNIPDCDRKVEQKNKPVH